MGCLGITRDLLRLRRSGLVTIGLTSVSPEASRRRRSLISFGLITGATDQRYHVSGCEAMVRLQKRNEAETPIFSPSPPHRPLTA